MRLTIWQFLALILVLCGIWAAWAFWGQNQDQNSWIRKMNGGITGDDTSGVKTSTAPGGGADGSAPPTKNPW